MLDPNTIVPACQLQLSKDTDIWIDKELYGINRCPKSFSQIYASYLMLSALNNPTITTEQQQCLLSKLQSNK